MRWKTLFRSKWTEEERIKAEQERMEAYYSASQWKLIWRKFKQHRLALIGLWILAILAFMGLFCEFVAPNDPNERQTKVTRCPPMRIHFADDEGNFALKPYVYGLKVMVDADTLVRSYQENTDRVVQLGFFVKGAPYKLMGLFPCDIHLFGPKDGGLFYPFGTDDMGRCLLSRIVYGTRISLSVGLIGVFLSFVIGCVLGGISGYFGGLVDTVIQRIIEFLMSIPTIPIWMCLSAGLPKEWSSLKVYFFITLILSIVNWTGLARSVRGKIISVREEDYIMAAKMSGATAPMLIGRHLLPAFSSNLIVSLTMSIPNMILGETALSFLGLGLRAPIISWGVLLENAQQVQSIVMTPWQLIPIVFIVVTVLAFNFVGDGLRDAMDPYK